MTRNASAARDNEAEGLGNFKTSYKLNSFQYILRGALYPKMAYNRMYFFCLQVDLPITGAGVGKLILRHLTVFLLTI